MKGFNPSNGNDKDYLLQQFVLVTSCFDKKLLIKSIKKLSIRHTRNFTQLATGTVCIMSMINKTLIVVTRNKSSLCNQTFLLLA